MSLKKIIRKNKNTVRKYGGLKEPSWAESIAALYIVFLGFTIPSNYYKLTFILVFAGTIDENWGNKRTSAKVRASLIGSI